MEKGGGGLKMFNIVSAWNKRRRSRSLDQLNPCGCSFLYFFLHDYNFFAIRE